jgi:signal peptide peptidase SppA
MKFSLNAIAAAAGPLWFGTEESHIAVLDAIEQVRALEASGPEALKAAILMRGGREDDPFGLPSMMHVEGDVGVIDISGSLINGSAGFWRLFGLTGYEDIKGAVAEALEDKNVKRILLNIDSGGGSVNGVEDAGAFIRKAASVKPVMSFTGGSMGSAAYWLGVSADKIAVARTALAGSVGTLIVHMEMTKALEDAGRKATVFRYGKFKALGHPYEKLTEAAADHFQYLADSSGKVFVSYAAERRGTTPEKFQKTMGEGRVLMGQDAVDAGLADAVMTFEEVMMSMKTLDKRSRTAENPRQSAKDPDMKTRAISKAVILSIMGGTKLEALGLSAPEANASGEAPTAEDVTALTAEATEVQAAFTAAVETAKTAAVTPVKAELTKQVTDLSAKVALLEAGASDLTAKVTASAELAASYAGVVKASIKTMAVALGAADTSASLTGPELLAEHDRLKATFEAKFPGGGVAAVNPPESKTTAASSAPPAAFIAASGAWKAKR